MKNTMILMVLVMACLMLGCANNATTNKATNKATNSADTHSSQTNQPASQVQVTWADLDSFTDINSGNATKAKFRRHLIDELEKHFISLAAKLPTGYQFDVLINDIDLAGSVNSHYWQGHEQIRVYDTWFDPKITLTYQVKNALGEVVAAQDQLKLKNIQYGKYPGARFMTKPFAYEKYLIKHWFEHTLLPNMVQAANKS